MANEELYRSLYSKYAPDLSEQDLNQKVEYALTLNADDFINSFYQKYTGAAPTAEQSEYINTMIEAPSAEPSAVSDSGDDSWELPSVPKEVLLLSHRQIKMVIVKENGLKLI